MHRGTVRPDGEKARRLRLGKELTQEELAVRAGCDKKTIENVEAGKPCRPITLGAIAGQLGVVLKDLIVWEHSAPSPDTARTDDPRAKPGSAPPIPSLLIGREEAIRHLEERLGLAGGGEDRIPLHRVTAVHGWPGVGKTSLTSALAHDLKLTADFPDGVLWASLGQTPDLLAVLAGWGRALGADDVGRAETIEEACNQLTALLRTRRRLLIVDDVWQAEHAVPFRVGGRGCATLFTTRLRTVAESLAPTPGDAYKLDVLNDDEAVELLRTLAPSVVDRYPQECRELARELEGLPLALQVAGHLLKVEFGRGWEVKDLLRELREDTARLLESKAPADMADLVNQTTPTVAALLRKSTERLDPETRERYAYLGAFAPKPATFDLGDLAAVWKIPVAEAKHVADELIGRGLLEPTGQARLWMHALLVKHAESLCTE
jgi:transcriptional regulator with XRE-family HTH domain